MPNRLLRFGFELHARNAFRLCRKGVTSCATIPASHHALISGDTWLKVVLLAVELGDMSGVFHCQAVGVGVGGRGLAHGIVAGSLCLSLRQCD